MNVEIGTEDMQFLFWKYVFQIFIIGSLQCVRKSLVKINTDKKLYIYLLLFCLTDKPYKSFNICAAIRLHEAVNLQLKTFYLVCLREGLEKIKIAADQLYLYSGLEHSSAERSQLTQLASS
jgi:hypothetical protein